MCRCFLSGGDIFLRTAHNEIKGLVDMDAVEAAKRSAPTVATAESPRGRFTAYCSAAGVESEQMMDFVLALNNDALLDCFAAYKAPGEPHAAFVCTTPDSLSCVFHPQPLAGQ